MRNPNRLQALRQENVIPFAFLAAVGLGSLIMAIDNYSTPAISYVSTARSSTMSPLVACPIIAATYYFLLRGISPRLRTLLVVAAGALGSACVAAMEFGALGAIPWLDLLFRSAAKLCQAVLMFSWIKTLTAYGARKSATTYALAIIFFAVLSVFTLVLRADIARALILVLPLISTASLLVLNSLESRSQTRVGDESDSLLIYPCTNGSNDRPYFISSTFVPLVCFAVLFGKLHFSWLALQDGSSLSVVIQVGTLFGSLVGGLLILFFVITFWTRENVHILKASLPMLFLMALWLSSSVEPVWVFSHLTLLNITHKLVYLLMWLTPFMFEFGRHQLTPFCFSYIAFELGKMLSSLLLFESQKAPVSPIVAVTLTVLILCSVGPSFVYNSLEKNASSKVAITQPTRVTRFRNAVRTIAQDHDLTPRETEIMQLLGKGFTSAYVADRLCISAATAKTHQKNIYTKLKVHSQQDLLLLIDNTIAEQYEQKEPETATSARGTAAE